jgi:hypothetical protein
MDIAPPISARAYQAIRMSTRLNFEVDVRQTATQRRLRRGFNSNSTITSRKDAS